MDSCSSYFLPGGSVIHPFKTRYSFCLGCVSDVLDIFFSFLVMFAWKRTFQGFFQG